MRRFGFLGFAFLASLSVSAIPAASASAEVVGLPEFSVETKFTGTIGSSKLGLSGAEITCTSGTEEGSPGSKQDGTLAIDYKGCKLSGTPCHSLGDTGEQILVSGSYAIVRLKSKSAGIVISVGEVHVECESLKTLVVVRGEVLGSITPFNTKTTKYQVTVKAKEGKQEFTEYENSSGAKEKASLEGSVNGGAFKAATDEIKEDGLTTASETELKEYKGPFTLDVTPTTVVGVNNTATYSIRNNGTVVATVEVIGHVLNPAGSFEIPATGCTGVYNPGESCSWKVTYLGPGVSSLDASMGDASGGFVSQVLRGRP